MNTLRIYRLNQISGELGKTCFRSFSVSARVNKSYVTNVTVIGAGHMGTGIAENAGVAGNNVTIADISERSLTRSKEKIEERLYKVNKRKLPDKPDDEVRAVVESLMKHFTWTTDINSAASKSDLIVENITERIELKQELFAEIDKHAPPEAIFTTNTSSLPVYEIAQLVSPSRKENFTGTHFFDRDVKLVEIVKIAETTNETYHKVSEWAMYTGKKVVGCKDTPGFIVNRLLIPYFMNALQLYERGDADMKDIDLAMKLGAGYPFGPFELADHIGLDILNDILQGWEKRYEGFVRPQVLKQLNDDGKLGRKTGEGFFKYKK